MATNHFCSCGNPAYVFGFTQDQVKTTVCREHIYALIDKRVPTFEIAAYGFIESVEDGPLYERRKKQTCLYMGNLSTLESRSASEHAVMRSRLQASMKSMQVVVERCFREMELLTLQRYEEVKAQLAEARVSVEQLQICKDYELSPSVSALCTAHCPLFRLALGDCTLPVAQTLLGNYFMLPFVRRSKEISVGNEAVQELLSFAAENAENGRIDLAEEAIGFAKELEPSGFYPDYTAAAANYRERASEALLLQLLNAATEQEIAGTTNLEHFLQTNAETGLVEPAIKADTQGLQLSVKCGLSQLRVSVQHADEAPCLVSISTAKGQQQDVGVHLVCVLDYHCAASDFEVVRTVLLGLVERLGEQDSMFITRFGMYAEELTGNKAELRSLLQCWKKPQLSNLAKSFLLGLKTLRQKSPQQSVRLLLFSDKQPSMFDLDICQAALQHCGLRPVHCWSSADIPGQEQLRGFASRSDGTFAYLSSPEQVSEVCTLVFGGVRSVAARDLQVSIELRSGPVLCDFVKVYSENGSNIIDIQELHWNVEKSLVFTLKPKCRDLNNSVRLPIADVKLRYYDSEGIETEKSITLDLKFVRWEGLGSPRDTNVFAHWYTAWGRDSLIQARTMKAKGQRTEARALLERTLKAIVAGGSKEPRVQATLKELEQVKAEL